MFKKSIIRFSIVLALYAVAVIIYIASINTRDYQEYRRIVESSDPSKYLEDNEPNTTRQLREETRKNVYLNRKGERRRTLLASEHSELRLIQHASDTFIEEEMLAVTCSMQEDLYWVLPDGREAIKQEKERLLLKGQDPKDPRSWISLSTPGLQAMQEIRYLEADSGTYNYTSNVFEAQKVTIWQYYTTGHELPESIPKADARIIMKGIAESVSFTIAGSNLDFKAKHLQATLYSNRGL